MVRFWAGILVVILANAGVTRAAEPVLYVEQPAVLAQLEKMGYAFADLLGKEGDSNLERLYADAPAYRGIADTIKADVGELRAEIEAGGRPLREFTAVEAGRVMDVRWLSTNAARFRLVGIVNRLDRRDFLDLLGKTGCGEVRLIYRLAYAFRKDGKGKLLSSRMPFNFNAVFDREARCRRRLHGRRRRWTRPMMRTSIPAGWPAAAPPP